jgi:hypothetical protein
LFFLQETLTFSKHFNRCERIKKYVCSPMGKSSHKSYCKETAISLTWLHLYVHAFEPNYGLLGC